jgi:hypothetical protein
MDGSFIMPSDVDDNDNNNKHESPCKEEKDEIQILSSTVVTAQGGVLHRVQHASTSTHTNMIFAIFLPSIYAIGANQGPFPVICTYLLGVLAVFMEVVVA